MYVVWPEVDVWCLSSSPYVWAETVFVFLETRYLTEGGAAGQQSEDSRLYLPNVIIGKASCPLGLSCVAKDPCPLA